MKYTFEKRADGDYQVRLKGQFVMYSATKDSKHIDNVLKADGFNTREEYFEFSVEQSLASLRRT